MAQPEPTLTIWVFQAARDARRALERLRKNSPMVDDAAIIAWPSHRPEPETCEFYRVASGAGRRRIWPELFAAVFDHEDELGSLFSELGVDTRVVGRLRRRLRPGTSILLVVSGQRIDEDFRDLEATRFVTMRHRRRRTQPREALASRR
jgi:uncharacterized membrane protein